MKHTPGPWRLAGNTEGPFLICTGGDRTYRYIARTETNGAGVVLRSKLSEANAYLIAAAPELLAALKRLHSVLGEFEEDSLAAALDQALDAIAKAEGRE